MQRIGTTYELVNSYDNYTDSVVEIIMSGNDKKSYPVCFRQAIISVEFFYHRKILSFTQYAPGL